MEATQVLQPVVHGDYLTDGTRLVMVLGPVPGEDTYWVEDAANPDGGVQKIETQQVNDGTWRLVERG